LGFDESTILVNFTGQYLCAWGPGATRQLTLLLVNVRQDGVRTSGACDRTAPLFGELRGAICLTLRPTIMSSWSVGVNPYASVAAVKRGEEPGRLGTSCGEGGDLPSWLGWELESSRESRLVWR